MIGKGWSRLTACLLLGVASLLVQGCGIPRFGRKGRISPWVVSDMVALTDRTDRVKDPAVYDADRQKISLAASANETVSFQLVIDADPSAVKDVRIAWSDLADSTQGSIPSSRIRTFRMLPIRVEKYPPWYVRLVDAVPAPAGVYDPLVPLDAPGSGGSINVGKNGRLALWVDLAVPRDARAGTYAGSVTVTSRTHEDWTAEVELEVFSLVLPDSRPIAAVGGFDHRELFGAFIQRNGRPFNPVYLDRQNPLVRRGLVLMRSLIRLAHEHRVDLFDTQIRPIMKRTGEGDVKLQWDDYDAIVGPYLKGTAFDDRIGCAAWPVPCSQDWPNPEYYGGVSSSRYAETVTALLKACREHFDTDATTRGRWFHWPYRGRMDGGAYEMHSRLAGLSRKADPATPILCQLPLDPPKQTGWHVPAGFSNLVDALAPPAEALDPAKASTSVGGGSPLAGVWLAPGTPPYLPSLGLIATPADARAVPWFAMKYRCKGLFLPDVLHWSTDPFASQAGAETRLFYPGTIAGIDSPLPSVRLKRLRRGLQDIAYLWILQKRGRGGLSQAFINALVRYAGQDAAGDNYLDARLDGWCPDGGSWALARRLLAAEAQAVVSPQTAATVNTLKHQLAWKQLNERTRTLRVEQTRSLVSREPGAAAGEAPRVRVAVLVDLFNEYGSNADVQAAFVLLPPGWMPQPGQVASASIPPSSRQVVRLEAVAPMAPPTGTTGRADLRIRLTSNVEDPREIGASVPLLVVGRAKSPPTIDGVLRDWPMRAGNAAQGFRLVGRRGRRADGLAGRQTSAFCLRDEQHLYIALQCDEPNPRGMVIRHSNLVHYEQLMACGEDLVEVLLDPGGKARGPEDLYHIVVKPNGAMVSERGIRTGLRLGSVRTWSAAISVAVGKRPGGWVVEMRVPLAAFGQDGRSGLWRVNFARYAFQGSEASSWSGASRHFYDPKNLGTMFVGAAPQTNTATSASGS
jgi:hypothetical protein